MVDSLFLSPAFIFAESSFIVVASIAAYELLVGDFIWAQQEEARQASMQSQRGRPGYDSFESARQTQPPSHGGQQHRSLSPGGRGRGGPTRSGGGAPPRRGSPGEELSLMYPSRSRTATGNLNRDARVSEEAYYSNSSDTRFASPGRGSSGDSTRRLFYKAILLSLLSRFILLPIETFCFFHMDDYLSDQTVPSKIPINSTLFRIILRISQTFPDVAFASALGLLVIFCAQIAFAAMPPLMSDSTDAIIDVDAENIDGRVTERDGLLGEGSINNQDPIEGEGVTNRWKRKSKVVHTWCRCLSQTILASKKTYATWNSIIFASYAFVFVAVLVFPDKPLSMSELPLWILILAIYSLLLISLVYVAALLGKALRPGIARQKNSDSLAIRLVGTCILLATMVIDRVVCFVMVAQRAIIYLESSDHYERIRISYTKSAIEYAFAESIPVLLILFMMHRKRKEIQNDVLILWSLGRLTTSNSQLDTTTMSAAGGEGTGSPATRGGGLGARRFQSYGGARGDTFPPALGNKPRRNMPRAVSSSGGGSGGVRPQHQHASATEALTFEGNSVVCNLKKGGLKL